KKFRTMVKGVNDKQSGFWMYLQQVVQPHFQRYERRRIFGEELKSVGSPMWSELSDEEKQIWKDKAKAYNTSHAGRKDQKKRREALRERKNRLAEVIDQGGKVKHSLAMPTSRRIDEIDQFTKVYFEPFSRDYMWKREHDVKELTDQYTWRLTQRSSDFSSDYKRAFFLDKPMWLATVNLYCEDDRRMIPSEISLVKFSIRDGFDEQRNFILALPNGYIPPKYCEDETLYNEERTAIRADRRGNGLIDVMRDDFDRIWEEIKEFTELDSEEEKIFVCVDQWNEVVGSFRTLYKAIGETALSRMETRFITIDDFFIAMAMTISEEECSEEMRVYVSSEMHTKWPGVVEFDRVTCPYHRQFLYRNECRTRACSMLTAHEAVFNFFTLCKESVFRDHEFTGNHLPNKEQLPQLEGDYQECGTSSMASARRPGSQTTIVNPHPDIQRISGYTFDKPKRFQEPAVYRTHNEARGMGLMRESKVRSHVDLIQLVEEPRDKLTSSERIRDPRGSSGISTGNIQERFVEAEARLNELSSEPSTPNPISFDEGNDFSHKVDRIEEVTREPFIVLGSNASDSSRRAWLREMSFRKNRSKSVVARFPSDTDSSTESSGLLNRPSTALSHVSTGGHVLEQFDPLFARQKSHQTPLSTHTTHKSSTHSSSTAFQSNRLEIEPSYGHSSVFRKISENSRQSGLCDRSSASTRGNSVTFRQSYQATNEPEFQLSMPKHTYGSVECRAGQAIRVLSENMRGLDLEDRSDFSPPDDDTLSRERIVELEPRVALATFSTNQEAIKRSNIISDEATFERLDNNELYPSSSRANAQRLQDATFGEKIREKRGGALGVSSDGISSIMDRKYHQNSSTVIANNSSIKVHNGGRSSSAGVLTRAATALPVNPSTWYMSHDRTDDMASGQSFFSSDGSAVTQEADIDTIRKASGLNGCGKDVNRSPVRLRYRDAADYGWRSRAKLPGTDRWASSMGGRLLENIQSYELNTSNIGFGPFDH
uniref:HMG box domain-containing protein n=1 Tax=Parascaris univalens TaxID=6257 RepID=A0A915ARP7_PARUN